MKQTVLRRLETLEKKAGDDIQVEAVFFYVVDGRQKAIEEQEQPVQSWLFPPLVIDRFPDETDSAFNDRAAREARKALKNPFEVPSLVQMQ